jgi:hypothetical protein
MIIFYVTFTWIKLQIFDLVTGIETSDHSVEGTINLIVPRMQHGNLIEEALSSSNVYDLYLIDTLFISRLGHRQS